MRPVLVNLVSSSVAGYSLEASAETRSDWCLAGGPWHVGSQGRKVCEDMRDTINERIVTLSGGTGSFTILSELRKVATRLWAIVTMTDNGGSSRRLIDEFGRPLPLGDLRQALVALSRSSKLWGDIFSYRFPDAPGGLVGGHSLGNLILHALEDLNEGRLFGALEDAEELLNT